MNAVKPTPYQSVEAQQRKPLSQATASEKLKAQSGSAPEKPASSQQAQAQQARAHTETVRATTNAQGEKLGQLLNATA